MTGTIPTDVEGCAEIHRVECGDTEAFVVIHALVDGRSFGGVRIVDYADSDEAFRDARALAQAMSRKLAIAGIRAGGAKAVMLAPSGNRDAAVRDLGEFIESLGGRYWCGADMGFTSADDAVLRSATQYVTCQDMGQYAARTVFVAMEAVCDPKVVAVQGLGAVGRPLAETLRSAGVAVLASDVRPVEGFDLVDADAIYDVECDVFAPCARGGVIDTDTVERLQCKVVCGGANNPLAGDEIAERLREREIVYVPGFVSNVGAAIFGVAEVLGTQDEVGPKMLAVRDTAKEVVRRAEWEDKSPHRVACEMADEIIARFTGT